MFLSTDNKHKVQTPPVQTVDENKLQSRASAAHRGWTAVDHTAPLTASGNEPHPATLEGDYCSCVRLYSGTTSTLSHTEYVWMFPGESDKMMVTFRLLEAKHKIA